MQKPLSTRPDLSAAQRAAIDARIRNAVGRMATQIPRRAPDLRVPLSFAQERMWRWTRIPITSPIHNAPSALRIRGNLSVSNLERALNQIVSRHEALRHSFRVDAEGPYQFVRGDGTIRIRVVELPGLTDDQREATTREQAREQARLSFDIEKGPLIRALVLRFAGDDHALMLTTHHIIFDGWSKGVMLAEVQQIYSALSEGRSWQPPPLPIQFGDFAHWQQQSLPREALASHLDYWTQRLAGYCDFQLPLDFPRPTSQTFTGRRRWLRFPTALSSQLQALAAREGVSLFVVLLTAWASLLAQRTGRAEVLLGTLVAGRTLPETEPLIGFFVNYLPLRLQVGSANSWRELLPRIQTTCVEAYEHQDAPFHLIVESLGIRNEPAYHPIFQLSFTLHNGPMTMIRLPGLQTELVEFDDEYCRLDLEFDLWWREGAIEGFTVHNPDLFDDGSVRDLTCEYERLLQDAAQQR